MAKLTINLAAESSVVLESWQHSKAVETYVGIHVVLHRGQRFQMGKCIKQVTQHLTVLLTRCLEKEVVELC